MTSAALPGFINNTALLLALALIYDVFLSKQPGKKTSANLITAGALLGLICMSIMMNPWEFLPGVIFDTRSILLSVSGLFFGTLPTLIATLIAGAYRLYLGGTGAWTGLAVIATSSAVGIVWRRREKKDLNGLSNASLYLMGLVTHLLMLAWMLTLPGPIALSVLSKISLPVILIFPFGTVLLGRLFINRRERIAALAAVRESEERFELAMKFANDGIFDWDLTTNEIYYSPSWKRMLGYQDDELPNNLSVWENLTAPEDVKRSWQMQKELVSQKRDRFEIEFKMKHKDGHWVDILSRANAVFDSEGKAIRIVGTHVDITERKTTERELLVLKTAVDQAPIGMALSDADVNIYYCNPEGLGMLGGDRHNLVEIPKESLPNWQVLSLDGEPYQLEDYPLVKAVKNGIEIRSECIVRHQNGKDYICDTIAAPIYEDGNVIGGMVVFLDITNRKNIEEALLESKERYTFITDHTVDSIWSMNPELQFTYLSPGTEALFGYTTEEWQTISWNDFVKPNHLESVREVFDGLKQGEKSASASAEICVRHKDGRELWVEFSVSSIWKNGQLSGFAGVTRNITERKKNEAELLLVNKKMRLAADSGHFGIWDLDLRTHTLDWDDMMYRIYNVGRDEFSGTYEAWQSRIHPEDLEQASYAVDQAVSGKKEFASEFRIVWPGGEIRHIQAHALVSTDDAGDPVKLTGINLDITDKKTAELALKESEERFRALHNASFGGIIIHDMGTVLECNRGLSEITGYQYDELIGMNGLLLIAEDTRKLVEHNISTGYERAYEAKGQRKNGEVYPLRLEARNIPYKDKQVRVVEFRDISEQKESEKERENLESQLRQAQKMEAVGRLAGGVAHDFNNLLGLIIGYTEMALEDTPLNSPLRSNLQEILAAGQRSGKLTRQLLAFARKQTIMPQVLNLNSAIEAMAKMLQRLIGENIKMNWRPGKDLWPVRIDPGQLDQILANLCVNARDAISDIGELTISTYNFTVERERRLGTENIPKGSYVILSVKDSGSGMSAETLKKIFEPFFTTKEQGRGTGLGLATVYGIVKQNSGYIGVSSSSDAGTEFDIYLPRHQPVSHGSIHPDDEHLAISEGETVLVVEDDMNILEMTVTMLERLGYKVIATNRPNEAVGLAHEYDNNIDLLLTDVIMPEMNGKELADNILSVYPDIKILFMSGYTADVIGHYGVLGKSLQYLEKPFSRKALGAAVRNALHPEST